MKRPIVIVLPPLAQGTAIDQPVKHQARKTTTAKATTTGATPRRRGRPPKTQLQAVQ